MRQIFVIFLIGVILTLISAENEAEEDYDFEKEDEKREDENSDVLTEPLDEEAATAFVQVLEKSINSLKDAIEGTPEAIYSNFRHIIQNFRDLLDDLEDFTTTDELFKATMLTATPAGMAFTQNILDHLLSDPENITEGEIESMRDLLTVVEVSVGDIIDALTEIKTDPVIDTITTTLRQLYHQGHLSIEQFIEKRENIEVMVSDTEEESLKTEL
ncbi:hypothetical protein DMENIID0001_148390 [Sergentomyia squamirostris]